MNLNITYNPTVKHLSEIKDWLVEENNLLNQGFFCQWDIITVSFEQKRMIVITQNEIAVGFLTYLISDLVVNIVIAEVKPNKRKLGIGKELIKNSFSYFVENGILVAELFCSPEKSKIAWKKMGFTNFPDGIIEDSRTYLYQILVPTLDFCDNDNSSEIIELWNEPDHIAERLAPKWRWKIKRIASSDKLVKPIIHPSSYEWPVCSRRGTTINEKRIMKNFNKRRNEHGHFLIINELKRF